MREARQIKEDEYPKTTDTIQHAQSDTVRLNKYLSSAGYCSRREADRYIEEGAVCVDGVVAVMGTKVAPHQVVTLDGDPVKQSADIVYLILHKPVGIISTTDVEIEDNIVTYMNYPQRIFPVGRLDRESSGLIIMTNDGDVVNKILRSQHEHEKEYKVKVNRPINDAFLEGMRAGVQIYNPVTNAYQTTKPCTIHQEDSTTFRIVLCEGLNRQIRRMCTAFKYQVYGLKRVRIMSIETEELAPGEWRYLSKEEIATLNSQLNDEK